MNAAAYHQGYSDAYAYDACIPPLTEDEKQSYVEGYGDGMDVNLQIEGGVCYQTKFEKELLDEMYKS